LPVQQQLCRSRHTRSNLPSRSSIEGFRQGLRDLGYVEGTNITVEYRWAEGRYERLAGLAAELVRSKVDLIVTHGTPGSLAAKQATTTIPIVMASIGDPVVTGVVASVARPGGNITRQTFFNPELRAKRIELLKEVMPRLSQVAVILNADNPAAIGPEFQAMETAARSLEHVEAVETGDDPLSVGNVGAIVALAARGRLLSIGPEDVPRAGAHQLARLPQSEWMQFDCLWRHCCAPTR
jgi:putative tryptophan/tyrosine transport system substrate-binding protein